MTRTDGAEAGAKGHSAPQAGPGEDPAAASTPAQVEGTHSCCWVSFCDTEGWLLRRFRHPGMHKKPSMMLIQTFLRLRMQHLLMEMCLRVLNLGRGPQMGMILGDLFRGLRSLLRRIYTTLLCWIWPHWSLRRNLMRAECLPPRPGQWLKTRVGEEWCQNRALAGCHKVGDIAGWVWSDLVFD
jgi:hypothetical protein